MSLWEQPQHAHNTNLATFVLKTQNALGSLTLIVCLAAWCGQQMTALQMRFGVDMLQHREICALFIKLVCIPTRFTAPLTFLCVDFCFVCLLVVKGNLIKSDELDGSFEEGRWHTAQSNGVRRALTSAPEGALDGSHYLWFGSANKAMYQEVFQDRVRLPAEATHLSFFVMAHTAPLSKSILQILIDNEVIAYINAARASSFAGRYRNYDLDISAYADDKKHSLKFRYYNAVTENTTETFYLIDAVRLIRDKKCLCTFVTLFIIIAIIGLFTISFLFFFFFFF